jgi:hypothetical protein
MPFREERGVDPSYDRLRLDDACEVVLIRSLDNVEKMADPRQMPPDQRFAYFDYVATPGGRGSVVSRVRQLTDK